MGGRGRVDYVHRYGVAEAVVGGVGAVVSDSGQLVAAVRYAAGVPTEREVAIGAAAWSGIA